MHRCAHTHTYTHTHIYTHTPVETYVHRQCSLHHCSFRFKCKPSHIVCIYPTKIIRPALPKACRSFFPHVLPVGREICKPLVGNIWEPHVHKILAFDIPTCINTQVLNYNSAHTHACTLTQSRARTHTSIDHQCHSELRLSPDDDSYGHLKFHSEQDSIFVFATGVAISLDN